MSQSDSSLTTLGRGSFIATSTGTWKSRSALSVMLNYPRADASGLLRGFAVVFAEDVPEVSTSVVPPGMSGHLPTSIRAFKG